MEVEIKTLTADVILNTRDDWSELDIVAIKKAVEFAILKHVDQARKNGEPYVNHVIETGKNLSLLGMDTTTIVAGILHDTLEDTLATSEEMKENFGEEITFLVEGVSKLSKLKYHGVERHVESLRKFFVAMASDIRVVVIKLADRLHNMRTLEFVREDKQKRIAIETLELHARLADRLGMGALKAELEDLAFPYAYPEDYKNVKKITEDFTRDNDKKIEEIQSSIKESLELESVQVLRIETRVKHLYSLYLKLKKYDMDISKIHDVIALRIIVPNVSDCYKALGVIHSEYRPMPGRIKDYIAIPKSNGYKSLHTTVFTKNGGTAEIQIRTLEMHEEAEYGVASHLHYKEVGKNKSQSEIKKRTSWTQDLLELQKNIPDKEEFLHTLKTDFFSNRVFVFTPKGDVVDLPDGSTPIDFAYTIHSRLGNEMSHAKVNGKMESIETILKRGDTVEIVTSKNAKPTVKWLAHVKTSIARRQIQRYLETNKTNFFRNYFRKKS